MKPIKLNIKKLEAERALRNESQETFAARLGIKQTTYSAIINKGSTKIDTINRIAAALHINPLDLLVA